MKSGFWDKCRNDLKKDEVEAERKGESVRRAKYSMYGRVKNSLKEEKRDEFYERVKKLLDEYGEVSDAIGRLTDRKYFETLSYEERQRYTMELSSRYLAALEKYKNEKKSLPPFTP